MGTDAPLFDTPTPAAAGPAIQTLLWCRPDQADLARSLAAATTLGFLRVGSPERGRGLELAEALSAEHADDLRAALAAASTGDDQTALALILDAGSLGAEPDDAAVLRAAAERGVRILCLDPIPASALELTEPWTGGHADGRANRAVDAVRIAGLLSRLPTLAEALEHQEAFGTVRTIGLELCTGPAQGSLGGLLVSALEFLVSHFGPVESIDAAHAGLRAESGLRELPGETLRGLHGDLTATARFEGGQIASLLATDRGGPWHRSVTLLGPGGRVHVTDAGFDWFDPAGQVVDHHRVEGLTDQTDHAIAALARDIRAMLAGNETGLRIGRAPVEPGPVLAAAQAALLSCRTGQAEHPATLSRLLAR